MDKDGFDKHNNDVTEEIRAETSRVSGSLRSLVIRTAVVSFFVFIAIFVLIVSLVGSLAPRVFMEMYRSMGAYGMATVYADAAADRMDHSGDCTDDCEYIRLIADGVEVSSVAFTENDSVSHAEYLYGFTRRYETANCHTTHSEVMDAYYADKYSSSPEILCTIYGYDYYVFGQRVIAMCALSDEPYAGDLGEDFAECETFGDALGILVVDMAGDLISENMYYSFEGLTAYAENSSDISVLQTYSLLIAAGSDTIGAVAAQMEDGFAKAYMQYKIYRLASAMEQASGDNIFESVWTQDRVSAAFSAFADTIKKI